MRQSDMRNLLVGRRGFTLVELMISIAMVMVLIAGVYAVFDAATRTTGVGLAVEQFTRSARSLERVFSQDFGHAVPAREMPCIVIYSEQVFAYADRKDMDGDKDGMPGTADLGGTGAVPEPTLIPAIYNTRSHRMDSIAFFARSEDKPFIRQTGRPGGGPLGLAPELLSQGSSREAWIWYGPLMLADNNSQSPTFYNPGEVDPNRNPNNYFANDWCLGRMAMLLDPYIASAGAPANLGYIPFDATVLLTPLGRRSRVVGGPFIGESRFDVAETSIADFRRFIGDYIAANTLTTVNMRNAFDYRFNCKPQVNRINNIAMMADELALTAPFLQRGVTQFIVEFAGDFMNQRADGTLWDSANPRPDGEIDFVMRRDPATGQVTKQIRWYGMPRNVDTIDDTNGPMIRGMPANLSNANNMIDVVPVADVCVNASGMEHFLDGNGNPTIMPQRTPNYAAVPGSMPPGMPAGATYVCTWTPRMLASGHGPWMIRITMTITDPNGRLPEGQTVQYVFSLPQ